MRITTLPSIDSYPTAFGRVRDLVRICRTTTVAEARAHLQMTGDTSAIVFAHGRPVGVVMHATLTGAVDVGDADAPVGSVMDYVAVPAGAAAGGQSPAPTR